jgi:hypothetical protein
LLKEGEIYPSGLAAMLGMKRGRQQPTQRLSIVESFGRGARNNILYHIVDPCVIDLIDRGLCLWRTHARISPAMNSRLKVRN